MEVIDAYLKEIAPDDSTGSQPLVVVFKVDTRAGRVFSAHDRAIESERRLQKREVIVSESSTVPAHHAAYGAASQSASTFTTSGSDTPLTALNSFLHLFWCPWV